MERHAAQDKRSFLKLAIALVGVAGGALALAGLAKFLGYKRSRARSRSFSREVLTSLKPNEPLHVPDAGAWLIRIPGAADIVALDDRCTHLGCRQKWDTAAGLFHCPCHGSEFDIRGAVMRGPASRPLPQFEVVETSSGSLRLLPSQGVFQSPPSWPDMRVAASDRISRRQTPDRADT